MLSLLIFASMCMCECMCVWMYVYVGVYVYVACTFRFLSIFLHNYTRTWILYMETLWSDNSVLF